MKYKILKYDGGRNAVVMTDMDGNELVIDCYKAEALVIYENPEDAGYLARLAMEEPANYVSYALKPDGLQGFVDAMNVFNQNEQRMTEIGCSLFFRFMFCVLVLAEKQNRKTQKNRKIRKSAQ